LASGGGPADFDLANARSGAPVLIELGGKPPRSLEISVHSGDDGASGRTSLVVRDVTQRRLIEERLGHARRLEIVGQLAGGVAHEINNPLAFVKANLETMVDEVLGARTLTDAAFREMVDDMQLGVERIRRIVLDLQTFAHEDGGGFVEACDVPQVVEETMHLVAARVKGRVPMEISLPKDCPQVHTTSSRLCLALSNLLINAADALAGQPSPKVSLRVVAEADGLRFSVEDNGPGFGDDVLKNAGEPFVTSRAPGRGAGLGLALSREFVKRAGGSIRVENRAEGGARITFWLRQA